MHRHPSVRLIGSLILFAAATLGLAAQDVALPNEKDSLKFAIIGDSGTGDSAQFKVAEKLNAVRAKFPYEFVLMMGDQLYMDEDKPDTFDEDAISEFWNVWGERTNPEQLCTPASPAPASPAPS